MVFCNSNLPLPHLILHHSTQTTLIGYVFINTSSRYEVFFSGLYTFYFFYQEFSVLSNYHGSNNKESIPDYFDTSTPTIPHYCDTGVLLMLLSCHVGFMISPSVICGICFCWFLTDEMPAHCSGLLPRKMPAWYLVNIQ